MNRADWNRVAFRFDDAVCDIVAADRRRVIAGFVERVLTHRNRHAVVVDLGCGPGTFVRTFGHLFDEAIGLDYAPRMIAMAKRRCASLPHARWICAAVGRAPALLGPVADLVVCLNVLTSTGRTRRQAHWASVATVNKPGGFALIVVPSVESARFVARATGAAAPVNLRDGRHVRRGGHLQKLYTRQELVDHLTLFGYRNVRVTRVFYPWRVEGIVSPGPEAGRLPWHWACLAVRRHG